MTFNCFFCLHILILCSKINLNRVNSFAYRSMIIIMFFMTLLRIVYSCLTVSTNFQTAFFIHFKHCLLGGLAVLVTRPPGFISSDLFSFPRQQYIQCHVPPHDQHFPCLPRQLSLSSDNMSITLVVLACVLSLLSLFPVVFSLYC